MDPDLDTDPELRNFKAGSRSWINSFGQRYVLFFSFPFLKKNILFFSIHFSSFWQLMRPKECSILFSSFLKNGNESKECNIVLLWTEMNAKNATFFCKEWTRTRERFVLLQKNERTFHSFFNIYIDIYRHIQGACDKSQEDFPKATTHLIVVFSFWNFLQW